MTYPGYGLFAPAGFRSEAVRRTVPALARAVVATVDRPMRVRDVAAQVGEPPAALGAALAPLIEQGRLSQPEPGVVAPAGFHPPPSASEFLMVRNAVRASLTQPRRAVEVAAYIGRPGSITTGHLAAMKRRGLVVQIERGVYARPGQPQARQLSLPVAA